MNSIPQKKPRLLFARVRAPRPAGFDGGGVTSVWFIEYLIAAGYELAVLYLEMPEDGKSYDEKQRQQDWEGIRAMGVARIVSIPYPIVGMASGPRVGLFSRIERAVRNRIAIGRRDRYVRRQIVDAVSDVGPDACFIFSEVLEYFADVNGVTKVAWLPHTGVPFHKIQIDLGWFSLLGSQWLGRLTYPLWLRSNHYHLKKLVERLDGGLVPSLWYGAEYRRLGLLPPVFVECHHPARDESIDLSFADFAAPSPNRPFRVAMVGNLVQSLTSAGLAFLGDEIVPALQKRGVLADFEFYLIGKFQPRPDIAARLTQANIRLAGYVENLADAVNRADVVLHPVPYPPGAGVRLCSITSTYACLVLHSAVADSFEEFHHGENCLVATTGEEFVDALLAACTDRELNGRLRANARATFERYYRLDRFGPVLEDLIVRTIEDRRRRNSAQTISALVGESR